MKLRFQIFIMTLFMFLSFQSYSQFTIAIEEISYQITGDVVPSCGAIDLEDNPQTTVSIYLKVTRPSSQANSSGQLKIYTKRSSMDAEVERIAQVISFNGNSNDEYHTQALILSASDFNPTGGTLYAEFVTSSTVSSCSYSIKKDIVPTFTISPTNTVIPCNSNLSRTFTVNNVYNSPGTVSYNWSVGNGWLRNGSPVSNFTTTTNTVTLTPAFYPPGNVNVTPVLDGVNYPQQTSAVSLSGYNPSYFIAGDDGLCFSTTYSVSNLLPGTTVTSWSTSNPNLATITGNGNQGVLTVTGSGNGVVSVSAVVSNMCGQTATITKTDIAVGKPTVLSHQINGGHANVPVNSLSTFNVQPAVGATEYYWFIYKVHSACNSSSPKFSNNGSLTSTLTSPLNTATINWGGCSGTYVVNCRAVNSCGASDISYKVVKVFTSSNNPCDNNGPVELKVSPNPIIGGSVVVSKLPPIDPCDDNGPSLRLKESTNNDVMIVDLYGNVVFKKRYEGNEFSIDGLNLRTGNYILSVVSPDGKRSKKLITIE